MPDAKARGWGDPSSKGYRTDHIIGIQAADAMLYLRREVAHLFMGFLQEIVYRGYQLNNRKDDWGYAYRPIRGYEQKWADTHDTRWLSNHSWGLAVDLDATDHPLGRRNTGIPRWVVDCAHKWGLSWGGDYKGRPDEMHFEFLGTPNDVAAYPLNDLPQPEPVPEPVFEEDTMFCFRNPRDGAVWIVEGGRRRHVQRDELEAYKAVDVLEEPIANLDQRYADVFMFRYPEG